MSEIDDGITRRRFVQTTIAAAGAAALPFGAASAQSGSGSAAKYTRYNVMSAKGQQALASYAKGYNETYDKTPAILRAIDSLVVGAVGDSAKLVAAAQTARTLIPWNGHPNGAYMARSIKDTFGVDSLFPALGSPLAFVRVFRAAEAKKGNAPAFSAPTIAWLDAMEKKYVP